MSVKVSKIKKVISTPPKSYLGFEWKCTNCGIIVTSEVVENTLLQHKMRNLPPMIVGRKCDECNTKHSMELRLS